MGKNTFSTEQDDKLIQLGQQNHDNPFVMFPVFNA